jgi:hypothetical protein
MRYIGGSIATSMVINIFRAFVEMAFRRIEITVNVQNHINGFDNIKGKIIRITNGLVLYQSNPELIKRE